MRRPGRKRPSVSRSCAAAELYDPDDDGGRGGSGEAAVASYSIVAISSEFSTTGRGDEARPLGAGAPQDEQKRTLDSISTPQEEQNGMSIPRNSLPQKADVGTQPSDFGLQASGFRLGRQSRIADFPVTSFVIPRSVSDEEPAVCWRGNEADSSRQKPALRNDNTGCVS